MLLRTKIILALIAVTAVPFLGLVGFVLLSNRIRLEQDGATFQAMASSLLVAVARDIEDAGADVRTWAGADEVAEGIWDVSTQSKETLQARWQSGEVTRNLTAARLKRLKALHDGRFAEIFVTDARGYVVAATNPTSDFDQGPEEDPPEGERWWAEARKGAIFFGRVEFDESAGVHAMDIAVPIEKDGSFVGVIKGVYSVQAILDTIDRNRVGSAGHAALSGPDGTIIAAPAELRHVIFNPAMAVEDLARASWGEPGFRVTEVPWAGECVVGYASGRGLSEAISGWTAYIVVPTSEVHISGQPVFWWGLLTLIVVIVIIAWGTTILSSRLTGPLHEITTAVSQISAGDFERRIPTSSSDEIGRLGREVNAMAERLAHYDKMNIDKMEELNQRLMDANGKLADLATHDALTGLYNVRIFQERLGHEIRRALRSRRPLCLVMLDLDHFKEVNDTHGHLAGDKVLKRVAELLSENAREIDTAARYGGEEFMLILPDTDLEGAVRMAERLRRKLAAERVRINGKRLKITASFGVASLKGSAKKTAEGMIEFVDAALYRAKANGRNRVERAGANRKRKR